MTPLIGQYYSAVDLGQSDLQVAIAIQEKAMASRQSETIGDTLILVEPSSGSFTCGVSTTPDQLIHEREWYADRGFDLFDVKRGGGSTHNAEGQINGWFVSKVSNLRNHVMLLERVFVAALAENGVRARSRIDEGNEFVGVWVEDKKIANFGTHTTGSVTSTWFALNVSMDLEPWLFIVPCGLQAAVTSVEESGSGAGVELIKQSLINAWGAGVGSQPEIISRPDFDARI